MINGIIELKENKTQIAIIQYLRLRGFFATKIDAPMVRRGTVWVKENNPSIETVGDIYFSHSDGRNGWIEVKTPIKLKFIMKNYDRLKANNFGHLSKGTIKEYAKFRRQILFIELMQS